MLILQRNQTTLQSYPFVFVFPPFYFFAKGIRHRHPRPPNPDRRHFRADRLRLLKSLSARIPHFHLRIRRRRGHLLQEVFHPVMHGLMFKKS